MRVPDAAGPVAATEAALTRDPFVRDARRATTVFLIGFAALLIGASLGLNRWPFEPLVKAVLSGAAKNFFLTFHGYAIVLAALFWGSRPTRRQQVAALVGWLVLTPLSWWLLGDAVTATLIVSSSYSLIDLLVTTLGISSTLVFAWRVARAPTAADDAEFHRRLRWLAVLVVLFVAVPGAALGLTTALHPSTLDLFALRWDDAAGLGIAPQLIRAVDSVPALSEFVMLCYGLTPLVFQAVAQRHLRDKPDHVASALLTWVVLSTGAILAYHAFPITGPKYVFGSDHYAKALLNASTFPLNDMLGGLYPRNGMPSMHFGWCLAASILWWRSGTRGWSRALMIVVTFCTAVATIYSGEHYVVDLVVAVPFVLAAVALCSTGVDWRARRGIVAAGVGAWLAWILLLRHAAQAFVDHPALCWLLLLATAALVAWQGREMSRFAAAPARTGTGDAPSLDRSKRLARFGAMFFVSGMAALVYQVLFAKELALVFGSTATATFTVLATFLGGMAIGSLAGGVLATRLKRPLLAYAAVEVAIAVYCLLTPQLFQAIQSGYVALASGIAPDSSALLALRVAMGALVLLVPTALMGTTLPLLAQAIGPREGRLGSRVAWLYFANTGGAALGALLTAYFVIPLLGAHRTTLVAALLNLMVALGAFELARAAMNEGDEAGAPLPVVAPRAAAGAGLGRIALAVLGLCGLLSLGLEVVYVHLLSIVAGNSVYAFGLMVATFLVGLSLGGEAARRALQRADLDGGAALCLALLGLAASVAVGSLCWNGIPGYFAGFENYPLVRTFASREAVRGLVCSLVMVPPTLFIGAAYVLAMDIVTSAPSRRSGVMVLGVGGAVNTLGNIVGVLLFGFVVLPWLGGLASSQLIAGGAFVLAGAVAIVSRCTRRPALLLGGLGALAMIGLSLQTTLNYQALSSGANVYFQAQPWGRIIDYAASIDGGLTTVAQAEAPDKRQVLTLLTNGKFQGNDAQGGEMQAQIGFAMAPLLHQDKRTRALVIGYGTGVTTRIFHEAGFRRVDVAELSGDVVRLADKHFASVNAGVSKTPGVSMSLTDGRNFLLLSPERYDIVSLEITSIWFAGAASLYNQEFYQLAKARMQPDGVLQQWMQLHRLSPTDILQIITTLRSEFRYVSVYLIGGQGVLVATNADERSAPRAGAVAALANSPGLAEARRIADKPVEALIEQRLLDAGGVDRYVTTTGVEPSLWISTDDNLRLEYDTPKANVNDAKTSFEANKAKLESFRQPH